MLGGVLAEPAAILDLLLGLIFGLLDQFVEGLDDAFLDALHALARAALREAAANVFHAAGNVVERIVFQAFHVVTHQVGKFLVAGRQLFLAFEQLADCGVGLVGLDKLMVGDGTIEQQRLGRDDFFGREAVGPGDCFVVVALLDEPAG